MRIGFDNEKYIELQAEHIRNRIEQFGGKLYLEFGGKLFDDYHAARVLPGFEPDSKIRMLKSLADDVEIIIAINANDIEKSKVRGDLGITYDEDVPAPHGHIPLHGIRHHRRGDHPLREPALGRRVFASAWTAWGSKATCTTPYPATLTTSTTS